MFLFLTQNLFIMLRIFKTTLVMVRPKILTSLFLKKLQLSNLVKYSILQYTTMIISIKTLTIDANSKVNIALK